MKQKGRKEYPLQVAISTIFITITLILGAVLSLQNYNKTSDIILSSANQLYTRMARELGLDFRATYRPMIGTLQLLRQASITHSTTLEERLQSLKFFKSILEGNSAIYSTAIGFPNGEAFITSLLNNPRIKTYFNAPKNATLIALHATTNSRGEKTITRLFFDDKLQEISRKTDKTDFDSLHRPWYAQATDVPTTTEPFLFHGIDIIGLSAMVKTIEPGVVIAFNITLESLAKTISNYNISDNSEVILMDSSGQSLAYKNPQGIILVADNGTQRLAKLRDLHSDVLHFIGNNFALKEQDLNFQFNNQEWIGRITKVGKAGENDVLAIMVSPVNELLAEAAAIRWQSLLTTFAIILLTIPAIFFTARKISNPLKSLAKETENITRFQFDSPPRKNIIIKEVGDLDNAMEMMKGTINKFIELINSLAGEQDLDALLKSITHETMLISRADGALTYLFDETDNMMKPGVLFTGKNQQAEISTLANLSSTDTQRIINRTDKKDEKILHIKTGDKTPLSPLLGLTESDELSLLIIPLRNRNQENIGLLCIIYKQKWQAKDRPNDASIAFVEALSGFAAVTLESRQMLNMQEALLNAFIKLIAGAIDSKSPYTGGHCQRVPEITFLLAQAACDSTDKSFRDFDLDSKQWQELEIACWLHDCGKVTTPEYVVDKSTKLETIYDRIHEIRMRFEVLKRDVKIDYWQQISAGGDEAKLTNDLDKKLQLLDDDYAFIAECNEGGEFMADDKITRLHQISEYTWLRTLDDRIGISWEELNRKSHTPEPALPVREKLLADKIEHIIERPDSDRIPDDNPWGFKLDTPKFKYNRGEIYNLSIQRGTLSEEERFKINEHMVQTIVMLDKLPFPKHLKEVPNIAGCHHETMDGKGYPKRLSKDDIPITGRMMAIADIFEALTASDRPYKKAKKLSEAIRILSFMRNDNHIDSDLFDLFLSSGAYLQYAQKFLDPEQIDEVDISRFMTSS